MIALPKPCVGTEGGYNSGESWSLNVLYPPRIKKLVTIFVFCVMWVTI